MGLAEGGIQMTSRTHTILSRREVLRAGAITGVGLAAAALVGCQGSGEGTPAGSGPPAASETNAAKQRIDAIAQKYPRTFQDPAGTQPKRGGSLTRLIAQDIGSFDPTKSGATGNLSHTGLV